VVRARFIEVLVPWRVFAVAEVVPAGADRKMAPALGTGRRRWHIKQMRLFVSHRARAARPAVARRPQPAPPVQPEALAKAAARLAEDRPGKVAEIGGPEGPEPTRYGDWERKGIASDF